MHAVETPQLHIYLRMPPLPPKVEPLVEFRFLPLPPKAMPPPQLSLLAWWRTWQPRDTDD